MIDIKNAYLQGKILAIKQNPHFMIRRVATGKGKNRKFVVDSNAQGFYQEHEITDEHLIVACDRGFKRDPCRWSELQIADDANFYGDIRVVTPSGEFMRRADVVFPILKPILLPTRTIHDIFGGMLELDDSGISLKSRSSSGFWMRHFAGVTDVEERIYKLYSVNES